MSETFWKKVWSNRSYLVEVDMKKGIFQGNILSPLGFFFEYGTIVVDT